MTFLLILLSASAVTMRGNAATRILPLLASGAALLSLVFALALPGALRRLGFAIVYGVPCGLKVWLCVPLVGALLMLATMLLGLRA